MLTPMRALRVATLFLLLAAFAAGGCEQPRADITGTVYHEDGSPVLEVPVRAQQPGQHPTILRTGSDGRYELLHIPASEWRIEFFDSSGWLVGGEAVIVHAGERVNVDFTMGQEPLPEGTLRHRLVGVP
jgi:hypothetical protein